LAGKLASQVIRGLQSQGVAATIKHFAVNEQETDRMTANTIVGERALREIYLRPFEIAIKEGKPWALMTAYNCLNGTHCDSSTFLLEKVLRGEWGWSGLAMSDWGGTNSIIDALAAGLDLEMPGPARKRVVPDVVAAIKEGKLAESAINDRVRNVLQFLERVNAFEDPTIPPEQAINKPEHQKLIREAGARGAVLLKNKNQILPLSRDKVRGKKIALLGLAKTALAHGGGSASVNSHYKITPYDGLKAALGDVAELVYAKGAHTQRMLIPVSNDGSVGTVVGLDGNPGFTRHALSKDGKEILETTHGVATSSISPIGDDTRWKGAELVCDFTPKETGSHYLDCCGISSTQLYINEKLAYEQKGFISDPMGFLFGAVSEEEFTYNFTAGTTYRLRLRTQPPDNVPGLEILNGRPGMRLGLMLASEHDADLKAEAATIAKEADFAIVFTGNDPQWESEGQDQVSFNLPKNGSQDALVAAVAAANPNTIVVNSTGVAISMPWLDDVAGLVQAWFGGQECGNSIADVLTGAVNPEGRLPASFPRRLEDSPAYGNFPGEHVNGQLTVEYKEGVFVGYRHYDRVDADKVRFPFGFGLSYSTFEFNKFQLSQQADSEYFVSLDVSNTGTQYGGTLVQVYAGRTQRDAAHPVKGLAAFKKVRLEPRVTETVQLSFPIQRLAFFDESAGKWRVEAGQYDISLAQSAADIVQTVTVNVEKELSFEP
jgi:beta-glucosidase